MTQGGSAVLVLSKYEHWFPNSRGWLKAQCMGVIMPGILLIPNFSNIYFELDFT